MRRRTQAKRDDEDEGDDERGEYTRQQVEEVSGRSSDRKLRDGPAKQREKKRARLSRDAARARGERVAARVPPCDGWIGRAPEDSGRDHGRQYSAPADSNGPMIQGKSSRRMSEEINFSLLGENSLSPGEVNAAIASMHERLVIAWATAAGIPSMASDARRRPP